MKINKLFDKLEPTFIEDYLKACGISDIDRYLSPDVSCFEDMENYDNMEEALSLLFEANDNQHTIGILMD